MNNNKFWGFVLIASAVLIFLGEMNYIPDLNIWRLVGTGIMVIIMVKSALDYNFYGIFFPLAFLFNWYEKILGFGDISFGVLLLMAFLLSMGFSILFKPKRKKIKTNQAYFHFDSNDGNEEKNHQSYTERTTGQDEYYFDTNFSNEIRYVNTTSLRYIYCECNFGGLKIYLNQSDILGDCATVHVDNNFGNVILYVSRKWHIEDLTTSTFGNIKMMKDSDENTVKTLRIRGEVNFGNLEIIYI